MEANYPLLVAFANDNLKAIFDQHCTCAIAQNTDPYLSQAQIKALVAAKLSNEYAAQWEALNDDGETCSLTKGRHNPLPKSIGIHLG